jgi:excisionase family DNA binding protein
MPVSRPKSVPQPAWVTDVVASLPPLARLKQVAAAMGVCPRTISRLIARGRIAALRVGKRDPARVFIPRAEVARYLQSLESGAA